MEKFKHIHLEKPNTLKQFLSLDERMELESLKITGLIGEDDFADVLDDMCTVHGSYDDDDVFIPEYDFSAALKCLDMGEATLVDGDVLPFFGYHSQLVTCILPKGIKTTVKDGIDFETGLSDSENLKTLALPEGLKTVAGFQNCPNLTGVVLPEGLECINMHAFCGCEAITQIRIPASVKEFDGSCFAGCNIASYEVDSNNPYFSVVDGVVFNKDFTELVAFPSAYPNKHFVVPQTVKTIGCSAFMYSQIETIEFPIGLTTIEASAFESSNLRSIDLPDTVTNIGLYAFQFCHKLEELKLSNCVSKIREQTFSSCPNLKTLEIPSSVKSIQYSTLLWCENIEHLILHDGLEEIVSEGVMYRRKGKLRNVVLPKTLKKVPGGVFNYSPFYKAFQLDPENPYFSVIDGALCSKDGKILYSVPDYSRTSFTVPEGIEVIGEQAFAFLPSLRSIKLPSTLKEIKSRAFQCDKKSALKQIQIPASVEKIDFLAFCNSHLKTIIMDGSVPPKVVGYDHSDWVYGYTELHVPKNAVEEYKQYAGWRGYKIKGV